MNQPPRVTSNPSGQTPANQYAESGGGPPHQFGPPGHPYRQPPPPRGSGKLLAIIGGIFVIAILSCGGFIAWIIYSFQTPSPMTAEYREHREPIGGQLPEALRTSLENGRELGTPDADGLQALLDNLVEDNSSCDQVDLARFTTEIQNGGKAIGVNGLTRLIWIENLRMTLVQPVLGESHVLDFEWLVPNQEARAIVASYWDDYDQPEVWLLYVTRASGEWKLYDWRDVLTSASETQYYALYTAAPVLSQDNFSDLTYELDEIYYDDTIAWGEKAQQSMAAFRKRRYPPDILPLAQSHCASYLLLYDAIDLLADLAREMDDQAFIGAHYYQGRVALGADDHPEAFQQAKSVIEKAGWHPAAAVLAGQCASTDEEKQMAAEWLAQSLALVPGHSPTVDVFFDNAATEQMQSLLARFADQDDSVEKVVSVIDALVDSQRYGRLEQWMQLASQFPKLKSVVPYGSLKQAIARQEYAAALPIAAELLQRDFLPDYDEVLWEDLMSAALQPGMLNAAADLFTDREEFLRRIREVACSRWGEELEWKVALKLFLEAPEDTFFAEEMETSVAIGRCLMELDQPAKAFSQLAPLLTLEGAILLGEDPPACAYVYFDVLAEAATVTDQIQPFLQAVEEPETALVLLAQHLDLDEDRERFESLLAWYERQQGPKVWQYYYQSQLAYADGQWEAADAAWLQAVDESEFDERFADYSLPAVVYEFAPDMEDTLGIRLEMAFRCGKLLELVSQTAKSGEIDADWGYELHWILGGFEAIELAGEVGRLLVANQDSVVRQQGYDFLSDWNLAKGEFDLAIDYLIKAAREPTDDAADYGNTYLDSAAKLMVSLGNGNRLPELYKLAEHPDDMATLDAASALIHGNASRFLQALDEYGSEYGAEDWFWYPELLLAQQRAGVWEPSNAKHRVDVSNLVYEYSVHGVLLLNRPASALTQDIAAAFEEVAGGQLQPQNAARFPQSTGVWTADTEHGRLLLVGYDGPPAAVSEGSEYAKRVSKFQGTLCVSLLPLDNPASSFERMRHMVVDSAENLEPAAGFHDYKANSWFTGDRWQEQLRAATQDGIHPETPAPKYVGWGTTGLWDRLVESRDGPAVSVDVGLLWEQVPIVIESRGAEGTEARLTEDVLSMPCLPKDTRITIPKDEY